LADEAIGAVEAESEAIVLSVAIIDVESIVIDVESVVIVVDSVVSVFFWQAVAKETIARTNMADFAKFFMILEQLIVND